MMGFRSLSINLCEISRERRKIVKYFVYTKEREEERLFSKIILARSLRYIQIEDIYIYIKYTMIDMRRVNGKRERKESIVELYIFSNEFLKLTPSMEIC